MIEIVRNYVNCQINGTLPAKVYEEFRNRMRYKKPGMVFSYVFKKGWSDGYVYLFTKKMQRFPAGLLFLAKRILEESNIEYKVTDLRVRPTTTGQPVSLSKVVLRDYQQDTLDRCLKHGSGIIKLPTGSGKTMIFTALLGQYAGLKRAVFVRKLDLMAQTIKCLRRDLGIEVGTIGGGVADIKELSVIMIPTAANVIGEKFVKYLGHFNDDEDDAIELSAQQKMLVKEYIENLDCFVIDECHCASCETMQMINKFCKKAFYRIGCSATPYREDKTDILIHAATGPRIVDITASEMIKRGFLVPPRVHFYKVPPVFHKKPPNDYQKVYTEYVVNNVWRNEKIVEVTQKLINNKERPIILVQRQEHGEILEKMLQKTGLIVRFIFGKTCLEERKYVLDQFEAGNIDVVIGSVILQEGIDIPCITAMVNASAGKSAGAYYQKIGRAIRPFESKTRAIVIDFIDDVKWLKQHSLKRIKVLKTEPLYELRIQE